MKALDLVGRRFGRLLMIARVENDDRNHKSRFICKCDCGAIVAVLGVNLCTGNSKSCGCLRKERTKQANTTHGHTAGKRSPTYLSWQATKARCLNPNASNFPRFGARGFTICARWRGKEGFSNFLADLGARPAGRTLRRIGGTRNYAKGAVAWQTREEQVAERKKRQQAAYTDNISPHASAGRTDMAGRMALGNSRKLLAYHEW